MRRAVLPVNRNQEEESQKPRYWAHRLSGLCCQAAGGERQWAETTSAAWLLLFAAAQLLDNVEDQDEPELWVKELGPGPAINVATGLIFTASLALQDLYDHPQTYPIAKEIIKDFHR